MGDLDTPDAIGERIVRAAAEAFINHGFAASSTLAIARAARTSKRAIYERFAGKDALFEAVMHYLCTQGAAHDGAAPSSDGALSDYLEAMVRGVLTRFALPQTRGVLAAAIGASGQFPSVVKLFWQQGPGQAALAIAAELQQRHARGEIRKAQFDELATRFILDCCGPIVLRQLLDEAFTPAPADFDASIETAVKKLLDTLH